MGKALSVLTGPFKNFNLESRAHKIISRDKPVPAPRHKKDQIDVDQLIRDHPDVYAESLKKHEVLDKHLKDVYVSSFDPDKTPKPDTDPERPLPVNRSQVEDYEYGFKEPERVPPGKTTLRNVVKFLTDHQLDPRIFTIQKISDDYLLPEPTVSKILQHFRVLEIYIPQQPTKAKFAGPGVPRYHIIKEVRKQIDGGPAKKQIEEGSKSEVLEEHPKSGKI